MDPAVLEKMTIKHVSLSELAAAAGVSLATASRAMRDHGRVSPELRERVRLAAIRIGYRPNPLISRLMHQIRERQVRAYQGTVAFIGSSPTRKDWVANRVGAQIARGIETEAEKLGFKVETLLPREDKLTDGRLRSVLLARGVSGVLMLERSDKFQGKAEEMLDEPSRFSEELPVVLVAHKQLHPALSFVMSDQYANARQVGMQLRRRGYRRPLLVCSHYLATISEGRFAAGLASALPGGELSVVFVHGPRPSIFSTEEVRRGIEEDRAALLSALKKHRSDVVVSFHERELEWLRENGQAVPELIGYVSLSTGAETPAISGIDQRLEAVGSLAMRQLAEQIARTEFGAQHVVSGRLIEGSWQEGTTLAQTAR